MDRITPSVKGAVPLMSDERGTTTRCSVEVHVGLKRTVGGSRISGTKD